MNSIKVSKRVLLTNLAIVKVAVAKKSTLPILSHICLDVEPGDILRLTATDLEMSISTIMPVTVEGNPVSYTVNAKYLESVLNFFKGDDITMEISDIIRIFTSDSSVILHKDYVCPGCDFPLVPKVETRVGNVPGCCLNNSLSKCLKYVSDNDGCAVLQGVHFCIDNNGQLFNDATDTHRLIRVPVKSFVYEPGILDIITKELEDGTTKEIVPNNNFVIHGDTLKKIKFPKVGEVTIWKQNDNSKTSKFAYDNVTIICRNVEGTFPPIERVLQNDCVNQILANTSELKDIIARIGKVMKVTGNEKIKIFHDTHTGESFISDDVEKVKINIDNNQTLFCFPKMWKQHYVEDETGERSKVDRLDEEGNKIPDEPFAISVNIRFFADMLSLIDGSKVVISMSEPLSPIHVTDGEVRHVVMPMKL